MKALIYLLLGAAAFCLFVREAAAQTCQPAAISYIVRDATGKNLSVSELQSVVEGMTLRARVATLKDNPLAENSTKDAETKLSVIHFYEGWPCNLKVDEFTLKFKGKTMRLIFNMAIKYRMYVIDSLPFQNGTFELDKNAIADTDRTYPARSWKKISGKP